MPRSLGKVNVYLEKGKQRTFAGAVDWPGWIRAARDEGSALRALFEYGSRYARALRGTRLGFRAPTDSTAFSVIQRLKGTATTDFGSPDVSPSGDARPIDDYELRRFLTLLKACWRTFDTMARSAQRKELRLGPRGGGRNLEGIVQHVVGAEQAYLGRLGWKLEESERDNPAERTLRTRQAVLKALVWASHAKSPARGPRGGLRWKPRYFVRRVAWHVLDHAWEIEDRIT
ncbi:MAG: hypothetical protein ABSF61_11390 [Anaerolineales bacterium]|jgi:hypothetical protein